MLIYEPTKMFICDNCKKPIEKFEVCQLIKRQYSRGKNFHNVSSDIDIKLTKIVDLCPKCMEKVEESYKEIREERKERNNEWD